MLSAMGVKASNESKVRRQDCPVLLEKPEIAQKRLVLELKGFSLSFTVTFGRKSGTHKGRSKQNLQLQDFVSHVERYLLLSS